MASGTPIRVLCADDHPLIRDGIAFALQLQTDIVLVAAAQDGFEAIQRFREHKPDVALIDLQMPGLDGIDVISEIRKEFPGSSCIVLTTYTGDVQARRALDAGAVGYLLKSTLRREMVDAIRAVHAGRRWIPDEIIHELAEHVSLDELTPRELEVLRAISHGNSNKMIGHHLRISEDTVKAHVKNVLAKLQANDRTHAVLIGLKRGYLTGGTSNPHAEQTRDD